MFDAPPTLRDLLTDATRRLEAAGVASPRLDARLLIGHALGVSRDYLLIHANEPVALEQQASVERLLERRLTREPVSRILGQREFWSLDFQLSSDTLDPRPDSETVIEAALALVPHDRPLNILDLGTGSGCLLLALLSELALAQGIGIDLSAGALATATANAERLGLAGRARFKLTDWRHGLHGCFDLIVANPPYIPQGEIAALDPEVALFDPMAALCGGPDGLDSYRQLAPMIPSLLSFLGHVIFEVGAGQAETVASLLEATGLLVTGTRADLAGHPRCVIAIKGR